MSILASQAVADAVKAQMTSMGFAVTEVMIFDGHIQIMLDPEEPLPVPWTNEELAAEVGVTVHTPVQMATQADEEQLARTFGKTSDELAVEGEKGYDPAKVRPKPHPEACDCIGGGKTCWYCIHGQHGECSADKHGDPTAKCPRQTSEVEK